MTLSAPRSRARMQHSRDMLVSVRSHDVASRLIHTSSSFSHGGGPTLGVPSKRTTKRTVGFMTVSEATVRPCELLDHRPAGANHSRPQAP
jgi:hypothetical protein